MAYGCLDFNNSNIVSLFGAMPWDVKMRQAFEKSPSVHIQLLMPAASSSQDLNAGRYLSHWLCSPLWPIKATPCHPANLGIKS